MDDRLVGIAYRLTYLALIGIQKVAVKMGRHNINTLKYTKKNKFL